MYDSFLISHMTDTMYGIDNAIQVDLQLAAQLHKQLEISETHQFYNAEIHPALLLPSPQAKFTETYSRQHGI